MVKYLFVDSYSSISATIELERFLRDWNNYSKYDKHFRMYVCRTKNKIYRRCILRARQPRRSIILDRYIRQTSLEDYVALSARMYGRVRVYRRDRVVHKLSEHRRRPSEPWNRWRERAALGWITNWFFARCPRTWLWHECPPAYVRATCFYHPNGEKEKEREREWVRDTERIIAPRELWTCPNKASAIRSALGDTD